MSYDVNLHVALWFSLPRPRKCTGGILEQQPCCYLFTDLVTDAIRKFVILFRSDRITVQEREKMELDQERKEEEKKKANEERTKTSRKVHV